MNYYDETLQQIRELAEKKDYEKALRLIGNELELSYVPRDFEEELLELRERIKVETFRPEVIDDEKIREFLNSDEAHQLLAVDELDRRNLRDYIGLCGKYLRSDAFINAKALLVDSLIRQQIDHEFSCRKGDLELVFNPSRLTSADQSEGFQMAQKQLQEAFMKEPSMAVMASQLLYKEALLMLPELPDEESGRQIADRIEAYIRKAFR